MTVATQALTCGSREQFDMVAHSLSDIDRGIVTQELSIMDRTANPFLSIKDCL